MTITQMEYVLAVEEHRHFKKAAYHCHVSQPTLSMQIQKLEDQLGIVIFDRSKSPVVPTREGLIFIKQAKVVINEFNKIPALLTEDEKELVGDFRLAVIPTLAPFLIPLFAKDFKNKYPKVNLVIEEKKTEEIIELLDQDKIDGGLLVTPLHNDQIIERTLYFEPFSVYTSKETKLFDQKKVNESQLSMDNLWILNEGNCFRDQVLKVCQLSKEKSKQKSGLTFQSGNLETLKNMVDRSGGYTILPQMMIDGLSAKDMKKVREFVSPVPTREVSLVHARVFLKERILQALEEVIIENIPEELLSYKKKSNEIIGIY